MLVKRASAVSPAWSGCGDDSVRRWLLDHWLLRGWFLFGLFVIRDAIFPVLMILRIYVDVRFVPRCWRTIGQPLACCCLCFGVDVVGILLVVVVETAPEFLEVVFNSLGSVGVLNLQRLRLLLVIDRDATFLAAFRAGHGGEDRFERGT
jgi:hypothetical protein